MIRISLILFLLLTPPGVKDGTITVKGTVKDDDGKRLNAAAVKALERQSWPGVRWYEADKILPTRVDKKGKFSLTLPTAAYYIIAEAPGHAEMVQLVVPGPGKTLPFDCDFRLPPAMSVAGVVEDEKGEPVAGATVVLQTEPAVRLAERTSPSPRGNFTRRSGPDGRFRFDRVADGTYGVLVAAPRKVWKHLTGVRAGRKDLRIVLRPGKSIEGRVVDAKGALVAAAWVAFCRGGRVEFNTQTGTDGRFVTFPLPLGQTYTLGAAPPGPNAPALEDLAPGVEAKPGDSDVTVVLK